MKVTRHLKFISVGVAVALTTACGAKSNSEDDTSATDATDSGGTSSSNKVATVSNFGDLNLAGSLAIDLPAAFEGGSSGSNLRLLAAKKSKEACMMGVTIKDSLSAVNEVGGFFCHMEVEKDRLKFGKKFRIMAGGGEFARLYVDNSQAASGKMVIGFCSNSRESNGGTSRNRQLITIDSLTEAGPKGTILTAGAYAALGRTYSRASDFDLSVDGIVKLVAKTKHQESSQTFLREVTLELKDSGTSSLKLSNKGEMSGSEFTDRGKAYVDGSKGSVLFESKGIFGGQAYPLFSRRSHFNAAGEVVAGSEVDAALKPAIADLPDFLPAGFAPDGLTGWVGDDCPDYDEEVTLDPESAAHQACNPNHNQGDAMAACMNSGNYEESTENAQ